MVLAAQYQAPFLTVKQTMPESEFAKIIVAGQDATTFLQGQLTNDLELLADGDEQLAAWCNPKGRVISIMRVRRRENGYELVLPTELAELVAKRLTVFRFRAKADFRVEPAETPAAIDGLAFVGLAQSEKFTPHMLNLDLLGALDFDKGCYTGQEVVARTHYRGATKRRALRFESEQPVTVGDKVSDGDRDIGEVLNASGNELLAVVPVQPPDQPLSVNGIAIRRIPLPYLDDQPTD